MATKYIVAPEQGFVGKLKDGTEKFLEPGQEFAEADLEELTFMSAFVNDWLIEVKKSSKDK